MKLYLAPIKGITNRVFRTVFLKYFKGIDLAVAPFLTIKNINKLKISYRKEFETYENSKIETVPQLLSNNPDEFLSIANMLHGMGYTTINWNLGCPYPMVLKKHKGADLLQYPDKISSFLEKVLPHLKPELTIKLRLGMQSSEEILKIIPIFNEFKVKEIIIHARTGKQVYSGSVHLDSFEKCLILTNIPVVYNGDINSISYYQLLSKRFASINRWMIGRGILSNPFLAEEIKHGRPIDQSVKVKQIYGFINEIFDAYSNILSGPAHITDKMKSIWFYLSNSFEESKKIQKKVKKISNAKQYLKFTEDFFNSHL